MPDNGNKARPVRTLTVKNFSVIKEAKLEFGKITVLIGPQASGKSLLCKLAYFLDREVTELAVESAANNYLFNEFEDRIRKEFPKSFPSTGWGGGVWSVSFSASEYSVTISSAGTPYDEPSVECARELKAAYLNQLDENAAQQQRMGVIPPPDLIRSAAATKFTKLSGRGVWDVATYIPLERSYFVDTQKGYRALGTGTDLISARFAAIFANSLGPDLPRPRIPRFLKGDLILGPDGPSVAFNDGRYLPVTHLSSGAKETLPILAVLDFYEYRRRSTRTNLTSETLYGNELYCFDDFTIEEPEASIFPEMQYELVKEFASLSNESDFVPHFTITTHSPYVLSAFGDLVKAGKVGADGPGNRIAVAKVIPESFWIKPADFVAYKIENEVLESIYDKNTGQIDGDYLDNVSGKISDELGQLLEIQYGR
jgi:hypothetical protein